MNRGVITISESGTVSMPTYTVWMTLQEIADMYNVFGCYCLLYTSPSPRDS